MGDDDKSKIRLVCQYDSSEFCSLDKYDESVCERCCNYNP